MAIKIFVDQGHNPGGINSGAVGFGVNEEDVNYYVGLYLANLLNVSNKFRNSKLPVIQ